MCDVYSRQTDEGSVAAVEEGAVDDLQNEGGILQRQEWDSGANREQHTLQSRQEEREHSGPQVCQLFTLPCKHTHMNKDVMMVWNQLHIFG